MYGKCKWVGESGRRHGTAETEVWKKERGSTALNRLWSVCTPTCHLEHCQLPRGAQASDERVQLKASTDDPGGGEEGRELRQTCLRTGVTHTGPIIKDGQSGLLSALARTAARIGARTCGVKPLALYLDTRAFADWMAEDFGKDPAKIR